MSNKHLFNINLASEPFENLRYRDRTVLLVLRNSKGEFILEGSRFYPPGIYRLLGGGVEADENPIEAALREMQEETGIRLPSDVFHEIAEITVNGFYKNNKYSMTSYIYDVRTPIDKFEQSAEVIDTITLSLENFKLLIDRCNNISADKIHNLPDYSYSWADFGKVYGFIQQVALESIPNNRQQAKKH